MEALFKLTCSMTSGTGPFSLSRYCGSGIRTLLRNAGPDPRRLGLRRRGITRMHADTQTRTCMSGSVCVHWSSCAQMHVRLEACLPQRRQTRRDVRAGEAPYACIGQHARGTDVAFEGCVRRPALPLRISEGLRARGCRGDAAPCLKGFRGDAGGCRGIPWALFSD